ncbi:hypothetical protein Tco_0414207 [Tanacetum coccineum]
MTSGNSDRDTLSKLLQMGTVAEYQKKEQNIKEKADITLSLPSEEASHVVKGPLDANEDTLLSLRSEDPNFRIQEKAVEYVRVLNVAPLEVIFAGPVDEIDEIKYVLGVETGVDVAEIALTDSKMEEVKRIARMSRTTNESFIFLVKFTNIKQCVYFVDMMVLCGSDDRLFIDEVARYGARG